MVQEPLKIIVKKRILINDKGKFSLWLCKKCGRINLIEYEYCLMNDTSYKVIAESIGKII